MSSPNQKAQQEMTWHQFFGAMAVLFVVCLVLWASNHGIDPRAALNALFDLLLDLIIAAALIGAVSFIAIYYVKREISFRKRGLVPFLNNEIGIAVAETLDGKVLFLPENLRTGHMQIIGSTGRGKTESVILPMIVRDLYRGNPTILIDGKGDRSLVDKVIRFLNEENKYPNIMIFDLNDPKNSIVTNPLKNGTPLQITDRLFAAFEFEDSYYRNVQHRICLDTVRVIFEAGESPSFKRIYELLTDDQKMTEMLQKTKTESLKKDMTRFLAEARKEREEKLSGLLSQLAPLSTSEVAPFINGPDESSGEKYYSLSDFLLSRRTFNEVQFILLPTLKYQKIAHQLGKIFCQEIGWAISEREHQPSHIKDFLPIYMDEFSAFVYPGFADILNKARSANVAFHLSHQGMGDLERVSPEFANMVNTNTNIKCFLGLNDPDTADYCARHHCCPV